MDLPIQRVLRPRDLDEALRLLAADPAARPIAGGTDLVVQIRDGRKRVGVVVDLSALALAGIDVREGEVEIGAATHMDVIASHPMIRREFPALAEAAALVGAWPIQCRATLGGNLANASPAADTAPPLLVADAQLRLVSAAGGRTVPIDSFFTGPGANALSPGELISAVLLPRQRAQSAERVVERFAKVGPRREQIISVVSLAGRAELDGDGSLVTVRLALGSVAPTPVRAYHAESCLQGRVPSDDLVREAITALQDDIAPIDDVRAPASYRRIAAAVLLERFLAEVGRG